MNSIVGFQKDDNVIWVEIEEMAVFNENTGESEASRVGDVAIRATQSFQEAFESVKPVAETLINVLKKISDRPDEISVEFGLKLNGNVGTVIAATGAEANFKVSLKWERDEKIND